MEVGIVGYGAYIPTYRIKVEDITEVWGANAEAVKAGLLVSEKSVPGPDEDAATIAVEASRNAALRAGVDPADIGAIYVGSESHPYAVKPTATIVAEAIGATPDLMAADLEFACKAGTAGLQAAIGLVSAKFIKYGLACGTDTSQGAPGDPLEYTASAGGASFIVGRDNIIATLEGTCSYTTDTPDFWRRGKSSYPRHGGRFTGSPAYFKHVETCTQKLMKKLDLKPDDIDFLVLHQPNGKFPRRAAKALGFKPDQVDPGILVDRIGNTYSGASPLGLTHVLDIAKKDDRILITSYGSGAGSDSFSFVVTDKLEKAKKKAQSTESYIHNKRYINYSTYLKYRGKIRMAEP
jgi:hydroxymethylglutaryl-CoA synthase